MTITKHIALILWMRPYYISFDSGNLSLGDFFSVQAEKYRPQRKKYNFKTFYFLKLKVNVQTIGILEDYKNKEGNA